MVMCCSRFQRLAVDYARFGWAIAPFGLTQRQIKHRVNPIERAIVAPDIETRPDRAAPRKNPWADAATDSRSPERKGDLAKPPGYPRSGDGLPDVLAG